MSRTTDVVIIGGGIAGLTVALAAAECGLTVVIIDEPRPGAASRAAAGMLAPSVEGLSPAVQEIAVAARDYFPSFLTQLRAKADVDVAVTLDRNGIIELASSDEELASLLGRVPPGAQPLDRDALASLEPAFAHHAGGVLHPSDGAVDNVTLMMSLDLAVARERRIRRIHDRADSVDLANGRRHVWTGEGTRHEGATIVLASGAWAGSLSGLPRALPVRPLRGQLLRLDRRPVAHVTYGGGGYLVPRGNSLLIGATSEETGFDSGTTDTGLASLREIAIRTIPGLQDARVVEHWAGLRPVTPDALPILGADPDVPALLYACGFSRNGILLAPWAAGQLAGLISQNQPSESLALFSAARFASK